MRRRSISPWDYDSDEDYYEALAINQKDQEYEPDDSFDPRECDECADRDFRMFKDNFYYR
ncbi:hypothetical protein QV06_09460 [Gallibacterium genomosp. 3]|uniref:Uncharacterized protein n=1 Tax=Gallibacterium genomosp. 3 TaxID=505345 RepID=A0A1A7PP03_9PAST|nr:hypothetical protein QV06_09460 [Gallibacterium genomosp. 3]